MGAPSLAQSVKIEPIGDGSSLGARINNPNASSIQVELGPPNAEGLGTRVDRVTTRLMTVQCMEGARSKLPELEIRTGERTYPVQGFSVAFSDGPPALWISTARKGRAHLARRIKAAGGPRRTILQRPKDVPARFSALRFAPLIVVSLPDWHRLEAIQKQSILDSVGSGTRLVISTGEGEKLDPWLKRFVDVDLGTAHPPMGELASYVPRASSQRPLTPSKNSQPLVKNSGGAIATVTPYGLGQIIIVGLSLRELDGGIVANAIFKIQGDPIVPLVEWLDQSVPLSLGGPMALGRHVWGLLAFLIVCLYLVRRRWGLTILVCSVWVCGAVWLPPNLYENRLDGSRAVAVTVGKRTLVVGAMRLSQTTGGSRVVEAGPWPVSLEASRGGSVCLLDDGKTKGWAFDGQPGQRRRITYLMWVNETVEGRDRITQLPSTAQAPWASATVRRGSKDLPVPIGLDTDVRETLVAQVETPMWPNSIDLTRPAEGAIDNKTKTPTAP